MTPRTCKRCSDQFTPHTANNWYCKKCTYLHYRESRLKNPPKKKQRPNPEATGRIQKAMESHANYLVDLFIRTGIRGN